MGAKASRWLSTLDLTKHVDGATVELIWEEYDQNHTGYLEGDEVDRLLKHWCAIHKISNFEQVRNEFWERFDVNKERRISKVNLLGGPADKDSMEKDKTPDEHKNEEFKKPRGSLPGVLSLRKKSSELIDKGDNKGDKDKTERSLFGVLVDRSGAENGVTSGTNVNSNTSTTTTTSAPRGSLFGLRNSGGVDAMGSNSHEPRGSLFGNLGSSNNSNNNNNDNNTNEIKLNSNVSSPIRSSLFGLRTTHVEQIVSPTEHRGSLFDLNKSRSGALEHNPANSPSFFRSPSPILTSLNNQANTHNILTSSSSIPELNLRGPRASLPNTAAPRRVPKTRKSLPNPTLAKVFSFLHDSTTTHTTAASSPTINPATPTTNAPTPSRFDSAAKPSPVTPHTRGTSPFRVFDLLTTRQAPPTPTNPYPALLITGPTKPLPLAAQVPQSAMRNEEKEDPGVNPSSSFPSYLNPSDCIDKELLRGVLAVSIPEFVLELELGRLHAQSVFTLSDAHALSLQELEGIVRPGIARGLYEFLHERRSSLSSPTLTPYRNSPNHSRSSKFREKLQGRTSVSWGSLSRSDKDNSNPLDLLEPPARFRPSKRFVFNGPSLTGDDLVLNYPSIPPLRSENSEKRFSI